MERLGNLEQPSKSSVNSKLQVQFLVSLRKLCIQQWQVWLGSLIIAKDIDPVPSYPRVPSIDIRPPSYPTLPYSNDVTYLSMVV